MLVNHWQFTIRMSSVYLSPVMPSSPATARNPRNRTMSPPSGRQGSPRVYRPSQNLAESPYLDKPFGMAEFINDKKMLCRSMPMYQPKQICIPALMPRRTPRKYQRIDLASEYPKRARLMRSMEFQFRDEMTRKWTERFSDAPYYEDPAEVRERSFAQSRERARLRTADEEMKRRKENAEVRKAVAESYKHDIFHSDEYFSPRYKSLRIIPNTERHYTDSNRFTYI